jgi:hypothetical protein
MSLASKNADLVRRRAILSTLYFAPAHTQGVRPLRDELEAVHGQVVTTDKVRADLIWLADVGFVQTAGDMAILTEAGIDVVCDRRPMPGAQ